MTAQQSKLKMIFAAVEKDHFVIYKKIDEFQEILSKLRIKKSKDASKDLTEARVLVDYFDRDLEEHMRMEEKVIFPFLLKRVPRLESTVHLLVSEHDDFRKCMSDLKALLAGSGRNLEVSAGFIAKICEQGTYLVYLLRSHMWVETHGLYKVALYELPSADQDWLLKKIASDDRRRLRARRKVF